MHAPSRIPELGDAASHTSTSWSSDARRARFDLACPPRSCVQFRDAASAGGHVSAVEKHSDGEGEQGGEQREPAQTAVSAQPDARRVPGQRGNIYTMTAQEGVNAAELVKAAFGRKTIGQITPRHVEVIAPDGPSTAGGKRARQAIRLVAASGPAAPVMCGFLDPARRVVELRGYGGVASQYEQRFGERFDVTEGEYNALCKELEATLGAFRYTFSYDSEPPTAPGNRVSLTSVEPAPAHVPWLNAVLIGLAVLITAAVLFAMIAH